MIKINKIKILSLFFIMFSISCAVSTSSFSTAAQEFGTRCAICHGAAGAGPYASNAGDIANLTSLASITAKITTGTMAQYISSGKWSTTQIATFAKFVTDLGETPAITLSAANLTINASTTSTSVTVTLVNLNSANITTSNTTNCALSANNITSGGSVTVTVPVNRASANRICTITFSATGALSQTFVVTQLGVPTIKLNGTDVTISEDTRSATVTATLMNLASASVGSNQNYCTVPSTTTGGRVTITLTSTNTAWNHRDCIITFSAPGVVSRTFVVIQVGRATPTITLEAGSGIITESDTSISINGILIGFAVFPVTVTSDQSYCTLPSPMINSNGSFNVTINVSANSGFNRDCVITFSGTAAVSQRFVITELGVPVIQLSDDYLTINGPITSTKINVTLINLTSPVTVTSDQSYCTVPSSIDADGSFSITTTANTDAISRNCTITFSAPGATSRTFVIRQLRQFDAATFFSQVNSCATCHGTTGTGPFWFGATHLTDVTKARVLSKISSGGNMFPHTGGNKKIAEGTTQSSDRPFSSSASSDTNRDALAAYVEGL